MLVKFKFLILVSLLIVLTGCETIKSYDYSMPSFSRDKSKEIAESGAVDTSSPTGAYLHDDFIPPHVMFNQYKVISINAAEIEIDNRYNMPQVEPNVEHFFPVSLATTMKNLIDSKLLALGQDFKLRIIIDDLSVIREKLSGDTSFVGKFRKTPTHLLKSRIVMRFELVDRNRPEVILGHSTLVAKRDKPMVDNMSVAEREQVYYELTESLVEDVYKGFSETVQRYFGMDQF